MKEKKPAMGRGLTALLQNVETDVSGKTPIPVNGQAEINISEIVANPFQPRKDFDEAALEELAESIRVHGIIQPITVRKIGYGKYEIIAGERRTRAAIRAELKTIPAYVRVANDQGMLEMALIENTHRENLNAIEVSLSYQRLIEECKLTQEELAKRVGKNRTTVTNFLRLLKLPEEIQIALRDDLLSVGHARALLSLEKKEDQIFLLDEIIDSELSVRQVESLVKEKLKPVAPALPKDKPEVTHDYTADIWESRIASATQVHARLKISHKGKGEIIIPFGSTDELERIIELMEK
ncbi:MAG: ParB/RepB/Spo0J family partition protein [Bacteroidetes bacterium]|nr:ParB/RepB/Spo0J family partition protein [Bacteroidota bacterium]